MKKGGRWGGMDLVGVYFVWGQGTLGWGSCSLGEASGRSIWSTKESGGWKIARGIVGQRGHHEPANCLGR